MASAKREYDSQAIRDGKGNSIALAFSLERARKANRIPASVMWTRCMRTGCFTLLHTHCRTR